MADDGGLCSASRRSGPVRDAVAVRPGSIQGDEGCLGSSALDWVAACSDSLAAFARSRVIRTRSDVVVDVSPMGHEGRVWKVELS